MPGRSNRPVNTMHKALLVAGTLAALAALVVPTGQAMSNPPGTTCYDYQWDSDHDGQAENWHSCGTPPCGCYCPVVGLVLHIAAGSQEKNVAVWASCQSGYGTSGESGDGSFGATVTPVIYPAGLQPVFDLVRASISCDPPLC